MDFLFIVPFFSALLMGRSMVANYPNVASREFDLLLQRFPVLAEPCTLSGLITLHASLSCGAARQQSCNHVSVLLMPTFIGLLK